MLKCTSSNLNQEDGAGIGGKRPTRPYQNCIDKMCSDGQILLSRYDLWLKNANMKHQRVKAIFAYELYTQLREHAKTCVCCRESWLIISK
jgi:hypothetical protein